MTIVVGGHSRNIGKTSAMEGILRALPEMAWTAVKITQHGHGVCSSHGKACDCDGGTDHPFALSEQRAADGTDSGRYLAAGARRAYWLRTKQGELAEGLPALRRILAASAHTIIESNSVLNFIRPDVYLAVLDFTVADMKDSARRFLDRADALIALHAHGRVAPWSGVPARWLEGKPRFNAHPPAYVTRECEAWLRERLALDGERQSPPQR